MLLLAIDTSGKNGSLALAKETREKNGVEIVEVIPLAGGTFSAELVPQISALLKTHNFQKRDLGAFVAVTGPGSFTGLRVGLAAIKALADVLRKPIAAVSLLEAVAVSSPATGRVLAALDAGRGEVYAGDYALQAQAHVRSERLLSREEFLAEAIREFVVTPDRGLAATARSAGGRVTLIEYPRSDVIARLGWERLGRGQTVIPDELEANYIRRSDAELFTKPKL